MPSRIAVVIRRLGPYHVARLEALAVCIENVLGLEVCAVDETYSWRRQSNSSKFSRTTLFETELQSRDIARLKHRIFKALAEFAPDCVVVPGGADPAALITLAWARRTCTPAILMSDSRLEDSLRDPVTEWIKRGIVSNATGALVSGEAAANYVAMLGMPREFIAVGYDVVDNAHFHNGAERARSSPGLRAELGLPDRYFLSLGRLVEKKNLLALVSAYSQFREVHGTAVQLLMVGDGPELGVLKERAGAGVLFRPFAQYEHLPALYALAEGFVLASRIDQWGLVVNEAMASSCPVLVSSAAGVAAELIEDGVTGFVTEPGVKQIAEGLARLFFANRAEITRRAFEKVSGWGPERFVQALATVAEAVSSGTADRRPSFAGYLFLLGMARLRLGA